MISLDGRRVLVTGAARGIGAAVAECVVKTGGTVIICDVLEREAHSLQQRLGADRCHIVLTDLASPAAVPELWKRAVAIVKRIDVLVNNAGVYEPAPCSGPFEDWHSTWMRTLDINLVSTAHLCREAINHFREHGGGRIVNIASRAAHRGDSPDYMHYAASKGGVVALTKTIARGFAQENILAYAVAPGYVRTELNKDLFEEFGEEIAIRETPLGEMCAPEDIANFVVFLASDLARHATGATIDINGGSFVR